MTLREPCCLHPTLERRLRALIRCQEALVTLGQNLTAGEEGQHPAAIATALLTHLSTTTPFTARIGWAWVRCPNRRKASGNRIVSTKPVPSARVTLIVLDLIT